MQGNSTEKKIKEMVINNTIIEAAGFIKLWVFVLLYVITFGIYILLDL